MRPAGRETGRGGLPGGGGRPGRGAKVRQGVRGEGGGEGGRMGGRDWADWLKECPGVRGAGLPWGPECVSRALAATRASISSPPKQRHLAVAGCWQAPWAQCRPQAPGPGLALEEGLPWSGLQGCDCGCLEISQTRIRGFVGFKQAEARAGNWRADGSCCGTGRLLRDNERFPDGFLI